MVHTLSWCTSVILQVFRMLHLVRAALEFNTWWFCSKLIFLFSVSDSYRYNLPLHSVSLWVCVYIVLFASFIACQYAWSVFHTLLSDPTTRLERGRSVISCYKELRVNTKRTLYMAVLWDHYLVCFSSKNWRHIFHRSWVIAIFLLKFVNFHYHNNRGWSWNKFHLHS